MRRIPTNNLAVLTGGAGFIATNVADRLLQDGWRVRLFDNLSRAGVEQNLRWLRETYGERVEFVYGDVRDAAALRNVVAGSRRIFHFAAQVAVTTSLTDPILDFDVNARGTLNLLEAIRPLHEQPTLLFTSTNTVYGHLDDLELCRRGRRYEPRDSRIADCGVSEARPLDFGRHTTARWHDGTKLGTTHNDTADARISCQAPRWMTADPDRRWGLTRDQEIRRSGTEEEREDGRHLGSSCRRAVVPS
jgi:GDP-mannose 4,6 dehydratase